MTLKQAYPTTILKEILSRFHDSPDCDLVVAALRSAWAERDTILNNHRNPSMFLKLGEEECREIVNLRQEVKSLTLKLELKEIETP